MQLTETMQRYIVHWGEMGSRWGMNRSVAQIHALLYLSEKPLNADEIGETLGIARSNISIGLKELLAWDLVHVTHMLGDRRDFFGAQQDTWEVIRAIMEGRKRREIDPTLAALRECAAELEKDKETPAEVRERIVRAARVHGDRHALVRRHEAHAAQDAAQDDAHGRAHREGHRVNEAHMNEATTLPVPLTSRRAAARRASRTARRARRRCVASPARGGARALRGATAADVTYAGAFEVVRASCARARSSPGSACCSARRWRRAAATTSRRACMCGPTRTASPGTANTTGRRRRTTCAPRRWSTRASTLVERLPARLCMPLRRVRSRRVPAFREPRLLLRSGFGLRLPLPPLLLTRHHARRAHRSRDTAGSVSP